MHTATISLIDEDSRRFLVSRCKKVLWADNRKKIYVVMLLGKSGYTQARLEFMIGVLVLVIEFIIDFLFFSFSSFCYLF